MPGEKSYEVLKRWKFKGLDCVVVLRKKPDAYYCGYVAVTKEHPDWGKRYTRVKIKVPGDLSFSESGRSKREDGAIEDIWVGDDLWWFGFDTRNSLGFDKQGHMIFEDATFEEAVSRTEPLAKQLSVRAELPHRKQAID